MFSPATSLEDTERCREALVDSNDDLSLLFLVLCRKRLGILAVDATLLHHTRSESVHHCEK